MPVKLGVNVRDGTFFNVWKTFGILTVGLVQWWLFNFYKFEPFAMLGGVLWATGNLMVPFIIQSCGLGVGQLVWSVTNMLTGWAVGTFGLFGKIRDPVSNPVLNYAGVTIAIFSLGLFSLMKKEGGKVSDKKKDEELIVDETGERQVIAQAASGGGRQLGFATALLCGVFLGLNFNPPTYLQQMGRADMIAGLPASLWRHSPDAMSYVFSHYCGIALTTLAFFVTRRVAAPGRCYLGREVALPGYLSGIMWGLAQVGWFQANGVLSYVVAFPIIVGVPGIIAALWGVGVFGENRGRRNLTLLAVIIAVQALGVTLIAVSK